MLGIKPKSTLRLAALIALSLGTSPGLQAHADTPNQDVADLGQAVDFVDGLAREAHATLGDRSLTASGRAARFRSLLNKTFNLRYIALMALGPYARDLDAKGLERYEAKFGDFVFAQYSGLIESSGAAKFNTLQAERAGRRDALVHMVVDRGGDKINTEWRVRLFDGEPRVIDITVGGFSLAGSERDQLTTVIKTSGLQGLMSTLSSSSVAGRT